MRTNTLLQLVALVAAVVAAVPQSAAGPLQYPATPKKPVLDTYHGVSVIDDYRWLENDRADEVKAWVAEQNQFTRSYLDAIPQRAEIARRVEALELERTVKRYGFQFRGKLFAFKYMPPANQPLLVVLPADGDTSKERVLLDPVRLDPRGRTTIDFFKASYDGRYVVVSLSEDGSEDGTAYVYEVATGRRLPEAIPRVTYPTGGGSAEWSADGSGFYYTRYPIAGERPDADRAFYQQVYFHKLGSPVAADRYVIGRDFPRIAEIMLAGSRDGKYLLAEVRNGDGGEVAFHLRDPRGRWTHVAGFADGVKHAAVGQDGRLYAMTVKNAPLGAIISMPLSQPTLSSAHVVIPEASIVAENVVPTRSRLYVKYRDGGPSAARIFTLEGRLLGDIPTEPVSDVELGVALSGDDLLIETVSYVSPQAWFRYDARAERLIATQSNGRPEVDFSDARVSRVSVSSKDGTRVPLNILHRHDMVLDGRNPVLLSAYGDTA